MVRLISAMAVISLLAGSALPAAAQQLQQAGVSAAVRGQVALARPSQNIVGRRVASGEPIYLGDAITSGKDSGMQIMLMDETVFTIGPNSEISIDQFVYDPETSAGKVTASVAKGVFRFITGKIGQKHPEDMTVRLPTATIGIRGTIVAGAVRSAPGIDPQVDRVFAGIKGQVPDVNKARDFVVLLGPGNENSTNDRGGAFVLTPRAPERAERGSNAGSQLAQSSGFTASQGTVVSRTNFGVVGEAGGQIIGPFPSPPAVTQGFTSNLGAQPPGGPKGKPGDSDAQEASGATDANSLSGYDIAQAAGDALAQNNLASAADQNQLVSDPSAGSGDAFTFDDLRAIQTGKAFTSVSSLDLSGGFSVSFFDMGVDFGTREFTFNLQGISGGGVTSGQFTCGGSDCVVDYTNRTGAAIFTGADATTTTGCDSCTLNMAITAATANTASVNISIEHQGNVGTGSVLLDQPTSINQ